METGDIDLVTLLFSVNVSPMQISQIMEQVKGPEAGTYTPKRIYDINQRTGRHWIWGYWGGEY